MMYKLLNNVGPNSLTNLFSYKSELTSYNLRDISSGLHLPKPRTNNMKKVLCMMVHSFGIQFQEKLGEVHPLILFKKKSLPALTFEKTKVQ